MDFFPKATEWLAQKAGANSVDWAALASRGQDSVRSTQYMDQYLLPAFQRCSAVIDTLQLDRSSGETLLRNYSEVRAATTSVADELLVVVKTTAGAIVDLSTAPITAPVKIFQTSLSQFIWHSWAMALTCANMHITGQIHKSGLDDAEIAFHASLTTMMFNVISRLDAFGMLKPIKKSGASGLGAVPVAVLVLGAVAIVAVAWMCVAMFEANQRNELVRTMCAKQAESGDPVAIASCAKIFSSAEGSAAAVIPKALGDVVEKVAIMAMIGAGVYLMIQFGPGIATKMKQSITAFKAS